jgi:hypothetical protein
MYINTVLAIPVPFGIFLYLLANADRQQPFRREMELAIPFVPCAWLGVISLWPMSVAARADWLITTIFFACLSVGLLPIQFHLYRSPGTSTIRTVRTLALRIAIFLSTFILLVVARTH